MAEFLLLLTASIRLAVIVVESVRRLAALRRRKPASADEPANPQACHDYVIPCALPADTPPRMAALRTGVRRVDRLAPAVGVGADEAGRVVSDLAPRSQPRSTMAPVQGICVDTALCPESYTGRSTDFHTASANDSSTDDARPYD
jgi:hypothetical protein